MVSHIWDMVSLIWDMVSHIRDIFKHHLGWLLANSKK